MFQNKGNREHGTHTNTHTHTNVKEIMAKNILNLMKALKLEHF